MIFQNSYSQRIDEMLLGSMVESPRTSRRTGKAARGLVKVGLGVFKVPVIGAAGSQSPLDPGQIFQIPNPGAAADVSAIKTSFTSTTGIQTFTGTALNGTVGGREMQPPRQVTLVLSNNANWLATTAVLTGINHLGQRVTENLSIPANGNVTLTTTGRYVSVISLVIPVQGGTGGTATVGIAALATLSITDFMGIAIRKPVKTTLSFTNIYGYPGQTSNAVEASYVDGEMVEVLQEGGIIVYSETAMTERDPVYVRITSGAGGALLGAFRNDADTASAVLIPGARVRRNCGAGGPCWIYLAPGF
jgi:hypothetical protein